jgi:hypothetical protein
VLFWSRVETGATSVEIERQHQDERMTSSAGRVQNSGGIWRWPVKQQLAIQVTGGKGAVSGLQSGHFHRSSDSTCNSMLIGYL